MNCQKINRKYINLFLFLASQLEIPLEQIFEGTDPLGAPVFSYDFEITNIIKYIRIHFNKIFHV